MTYCGPKSSLCVMLISIWGLIQLVMMGIFYYTQSLAFAEDLPMAETYTSLDEFYTHVDGGYSQNAQSCWIAACLYIVTLCLSAQQWYVNHRSTYQV